MRNLAGGLHLDIGNTSRGAPFLASFCLVPVDLIPSFRTEPTMISDEGKDKPRTDGTFSINRTTASATTT